MKISDDEAHALDVRKAGAVGDGNAGGFLPPMLKGVETEINLAGCVGMSVDGDDAALLAEFGVFFSAARTTERGFAADDLRGLTLDAFDEQVPAHAKTSLALLSWRVDSRDWDQDCLRSGTAVEMTVQPSTAK